MSELSKFGLQMVERREDTKDRQLLHLEVFRKYWPARLLRALPLWFRPKPLAKTGIRTDSVRSSDVMRHRIEELFVNAESKQEQAVEEQALAPLLGLFVYMWVHPSWRSKGLGDVLLDMAKAACAARRNTKYMLLVHDDNGSGKLVRYYEQRGFHAVFDIVDKGLICSL